MQVELRLRGAASRLVNVAFEGFDVTIDESETVIRGDTCDEIEALGLIDRARNLGFTVVGWRSLDRSAPPD